MSTDAAPPCWVLSDGNVGMEVQCLGLAEAMGLTPVKKRVSLRAPWSWLPPQLIPAPLAKQEPTADALTPPWPDILISSGRQSVAPAIAIRRASAGTTFTVQIQNPTVPLRHFDVVIAPAHDGLVGDNVIETRGALGRVTPERLAAAADQFRATFDHLPRPRLAVLLGGNNKAYRLTEQIARTLATNLAAAARHTGGGLMVTASRRTTPAVMQTLREGLKETPAVIWSGDGDNPYFGLLALADHIVVTADSVNMVSEAAGTGRPVYVVALDGHSYKFARFHRAMADAGITRPFTGTLGEWSYEPLREAERVAGSVMDLWRAARSMYVPHTSP